MITFILFTLCGTTLCGVVEFYILDEHEKED